MSAECWETCPVIKGMQGNESVARSFPLSHAQDLQDALSRSVNCSGAGVTQATHLKEGFFRSSTVIVDQPTCGLNEVSKHPQIEVTVMDQGLVVNLPQVEIAENPLGIAEIPQ